MTPHPTPINCLHRDDGRALAVCCFCGQVSRPVTAERGEPSWNDLPRGWDVFPFPPDHVHEDGGVGSEYVCPTCRARLRAGETMKMRGEGPLSARWSTLLPRYP